MIYGIWSKEREGGERERKRKQENGTAEKKKTADRPDGSFQASVAGKDGDRRLGFGKGGAASRGYENWRLVSGLALFCGAAAATIIIIKTIKTIRSSSFITSVVRRSIAHKSSIITLTGNI